MVYTFNAFSRSRGKVYSRDVTDYIEAGHFTPAELCKQLADQCWADYAEVCCEDPYVELAVIDRLNP